VQNNKYFSARWLNLLIIRKMMAEEFECGCDRSCVISLRGPYKDGSAKVNDREAGSK
jgi:hypothetical protein